MVALSLATIGFGARWRITPPQGALGKLGNPRFLHGRHRRAGPASAAGVTTASALSLPSLISG